MSEMLYNPFETAQKQFDRAADLLELDQATRDLLRDPIREYHFSIPVRMDDGRVRESDSECRISISRSNEQETLLLQVEKWRLTPFPSGGIIRLYNKAAKALIHRPYRFQL